MRRRFPFVAVVERAKDKRFVVVDDDGATGTEITLVAATADDTLPTAATTDVLAAEASPISSTVWDVVVASSLAATSSGIIFRRRIFRRHGQSNHDDECGRADGVRLRAMCEKVTEHDDNGITSKIRESFREFALNFVAAAAAAAVRLLADMRDNVFRHCCSMSESDSDSRSSRLK